MRRKNMGIGLVCLSAFMLLTACGHTHKAVGNWNSDVNSHWHVCECGEIIDAAEHKLEQDLCSVCGNEVVVYDDGGKEWAVYNENGDCIRRIVYSADGNVEYEERNEYKYDADGNLTEIKSYSGDALSYEYEYAMSSSGEVYVAKDTTYYEDNSKSYNEYDENENILKSIMYAADGSIEYAVESEYEDRAEGLWMGEKEYHGTVLTAEREYIYASEGFQITKDVIYNEDGSIQSTEYDLNWNVVGERYTNTDGEVEYDKNYEHTYDNDGNIVYTKTYDQGVLTEEVEYLVGSDEDGTWSKSGRIVVYHEDGSKTVSDGDWEGTWSSEITYDSNGNAIEELRYEYLNDENGESIGSKSYRNGQLTQEIHNITDDAGNAIGISITDYTEDGGKLVYEYDAEFEFVRGKEYDAAGNVINELDAEDEAE